MRRFLLDKRIPAGKVTLLAAPGGSCKTTWAMGLALHRAIALDYLGLKTSPGATAFVTLEDSTEDLIDKAKVWTRADPRLAGAADKIAIIDVPRMVTVELDERPLEMPTFVTSRFGRHRVEVATVDAIASTIADLKLGIDLIVVETASRWGSGDESNGTAAALISACERLSFKTGAAILLTHHSGKAAKRDRVIDAYVARGASAFGDNARSVLYIGAPNTAKLHAWLGDAPTDEQMDRWLVFSHEKSNFGIKGEDVFLAPRAYRERDADPSLGLTLERVQSPDEQAVRAARNAARERRAGVGRALAAIVERLGADGVEPTERAMRDLPAEERPVAKAKMGAALRDAVRDGLLFDSGRRSKGGVVYEVARSGPGQTETLQAAQAATGSGPAARAPKEAGPGQILARPDGLLPEPLP
jgi:RecA-family ATPase